MSSRTDFVDQNFAVRSQSAKSVKMITLENLVPYATSLMKGQKLNVYLLNCIRVAKLELHVFLEFHIIIPQGRNSWDTGMCECWCTQVRFAWAPRTAASEVDKSLPNPVLSLSYLHTHTRYKGDSVLFILPTLFTCYICPHILCYMSALFSTCYLSVSTIQHIHQAYMYMLHTYIHLLSVVCYITKNKKSSLVQAFCKHFTCTR